MKEFIGKTLLLCLLFACKKEPITAPQSNNTATPVDTFYNVKYEYIGDCCTHYYYYTYNDRAYTHVWANGSNNWDYSFTAKQGTNLSLWAKTTFGGGNYNMTRITIYVNGSSVKTDYAYIPDTLRYTL